MIDLKRLRQDPDGSRASLLRRRDPALAIGLEQVLELDRRRRDLLGRAEALKAERNAASEEVARLKRANEPAAELMARLKESGDAVKGLDAELREVDGALDVTAMSLPNFALDGVPDGDATAGRLTSSAGAPFARRGAKGPAHPEARRPRRPRVGSSDAPMSRRRRPDWLVFR